MTDRIPRSCREDSQNWADLSEREMALCITVPANDPGRPVFLSVPLNRLDRNA